MTSCGQATATPVGRLFKVTHQGAARERSAVYDCLVGVYCEERVHESGGAVHGVRLRADGPVPRHAGGRGGAAAMRPLAKLL